MSKFCGCARRYVILAFWAVVLMAILSSFLPRALQAQCYDFWNSRLAYIRGQPVCAYTGTLCIECHAGGGVCFGDADGNTECVMYDIE